MRSSTLGARKDSGKCSKGAEVLIAAIAPLSSGFLPELNSTVGV